MTEAQIKRILRDLKKNQETLDAIHGSLDAVRTGFELTAFRIDALEDAVELIKERLDRLELRH